MTTLDVDRLRYLRTLQDQHDLQGLLPHQRIEEGTFDLHLVEGGRGSAKSFGLSHYLSRFMRRHAGARARIISPTLGDAIEALVEGPSGVKAADPSAKWLPSAPGGSKLLWANSSECLVLGTPTLRDVDRLRASGNRHLDIWDEAAANPCLDAAWKQADLGRRLVIDGIQPHSVMGTTPKPTKAYREIRAKAIAAGTYVHATMDDNPYLSDEWKAHMRELYGGTRIGRQEIGGELLEDIEGAMWTALLIDAGRVKKAPDMEKVVVGVDPSGGGPDDQGIIVVGKAAGHYYVLADYTCHLSPEGWGRRVLQAYDETNADLIVWEKNYGGEMVPATIRAAAVMAGRSCPPLKEVWASRGKRLRAEPIAALYGDRDHPETSEPRIHHVGALPRLEDEMLTFTGDSGEASPNRLDACVEALTDLIEATYAVGAVRVPGRDY